MSICLQRHSDQHRFIIMVKMNKLPFMIFMFANEMTLCQFQKLDEGPVRSLNNLILFFKKGRNTFNVILCNTCLYKKYFNMIFEYQG